jgi:hypothetical protein
LARLTEADLLARVEQLRASLTSRVIDATPVSTADQGSTPICSTRRRKPGVCQNTLAVPIAETNNTVLELIAGEILGTHQIEDLLRLVDTPPDPRRT